MADPTLLIVAKAPVPGLCKTRIAETVGDVAAAEVAAASLLDTLETADAVGWPVVVAMTGDLDMAVDSDRVRRALARVHVVEQRGESFAERLVHAHADSDAGDGVVQVGMDTPQILAEDYIRAGAVVRSGEIALGPADDGGWWLLAVPEASHARGLVDVPMSTPKTAEHTAQALGEVTWLRVLRDMDTWADTVALSRQLPTSRLARAVDRISGVGHD